MKHSATFMLFLLFCSPVFAHKITVDALYDNGVVYVECWLGSGDPAAGADLTVTDEEGNTLLAAKLDDDGYYEYKPVKGGQLLFTVDAHLGHKGEYELDLSGIEIVNKDSQEAVSTAPDKMTIGQETEASQSADGDGASATAAPAEGQVQQAPAKEKAENRPRLRETRGGLSEGERVILGIICLASVTAAYLGYRNQRRISALEELLRARNMDSR